MLVAGKTDHLGTHAHTGHLGASMSSVRIPGSLRRPISKPASAGPVKKDASVTTLVTRVVQSSGSSALDEEALAVLKRANPLPAAPDQVGGMTFDQTLPIQFRIK
jgi:TonB family protein